MSDDTPHPDAGGGLKREMVRDMGDLERVWVEWGETPAATFATIRVQKHGQPERMLSLEREEISELVDALKEAEAGLPSSEVSKSGD